MTSTKSLAVITGATGGIGSAISRRLASEGRTLFLHGWRNASGLAALSAELGAQFCVADLAAEKGTDKFFLRFEEWAQTHTSGKTVSISFIFAAGTDLMTPEMKALPFEQRARRAAALDLFAPVSLARRFAGWRQTHNRDGKKINDSVLFFSWDGAFRGMEGETAQIYALTKGGLASFARSFAQDQAGRMRVLTVSPGWIATAWGKQASQTANRRVRRESLARRWGTPEEVADLAAFLVSDRAQYLNAVNVPLNGGFSYRGN